uniref:Tc1-like transposase DDE domain-containing protein n=1 Tax=Paramormyrops kingsleyae TaxID=1676925 RepID=A0A3B3T1T2_9TELE
MQRSNKRNYRKGSKTTKSWLEQRSLTVMVWPGPSPDLNPIENLWVHIKARLVGRKFRSNNQLWEAVRHEWKSIDAAHCKRLSDSLPKRLSFLRKNEGKAISYSYVH